MSVHRLDTYSQPAYCCEGAWIVTYEGDMPRIWFVEKVERRWKDRSGEANPAEDGSLRSFEPESAYGRCRNGQNPCLLHIAGQPHPWFFETGWERLSVLSLPGTVQDF